MASELAKTIHSNRTKPWKKWLIGIVIVVVAAGLFLWFQDRKTQENNRPHFQTQELKRGDISLTITATGNLSPTNEITVGSELSGTCVEIYADSNDEVKKDQPLAKLDTVKFAQNVESNRASLLSAQANLKQTQATLEENEATLARYEELHRLSNGQSPSKADMQTAKAAVSRASADLESAKASIAIAEANLKTTERDLGKTVITSPVNGIILTRSLEVGQTVAASLNAPELFTIAEDLRKMDLVVTVAEADIGKVQKGQTATFTVDAWPNRNFTAKIKKVSYGSTVTENVVTYDTELEVTNDDMSLRPGMTATADIAVSSAKDVFLIPNAALRFDPARVAAASNATEPKKSFMQSLMPGPPRRRGGGGQSSKEGAGGDEKKPTPHVWILKNGRPEKINVTTGITDGKFTEASGPELKDGLPIITSVNPTSGN
ncbi:efflux RND transporter periplasmic adaptor subunit [Luteolibacter pohnpeiensis]|uniref:Efflux RND transporter periplasmic adaptor subunit n=1 Tax=Luteolibacter pohnpeiensis TaxID=454153 RepID=A0A934SEX7_9BACT|nr:efflux RND transporter periplasmic adaptor subunit [Luteolibacter pohnpeiensis]MBK1883938.1 efflux RND transporter periplasmic adaptor subunit [Luteolibacter pohnpeiensis]